MLGPFSDDNEPAFQLARHSNVIPQPHEPNKCWLFVDLSYPAGVSVNDGSDTALCFLT